MIAQAYLNYFNYFIGVISTKVRIISEKLNGLDFTKEVFLNELGLKMKICLFVTHQLQASICINY